MKSISIFIGKFIIKFMELLRFNTSVFPGYIVLKIYPNLLKKIKYPKLTIMVTGSSGKGSTTKLITDSLIKNGYTVTTNSKGSNLINAFATMIINDCNLNGEINTDALVYEIDEKFLKIITKYLKPNYLIINNITRDQPPRQGNFDIVFNEIKKGIFKNTHLIVNGDDPITRKFSLYHKGKITYYGISKNIYSTDKILNNIKDNLYCPKCNNKLNFDYYHYGSVGNYNCPNCDFKRDNIKYEITNVDINNMNITINNKSNIEINNYILFNLYNILTCYSLLSEIKIKEDNIIKSLNNIDLDKKIVNEFIFNNRKVTTLNCKAENNATYNLSLLYTSIDNEEKTIVLGLKEISRRYNFYDLSWLFDISFELLKTSKIDKIILIGPYRYDFAYRIKYAGIDENKFIILENFQNLNNILKNETKGNIYGILNFDYVEPFINSLKEEK